MNPRQREAILHSEGPLLILAGAGSGKTTVISRKFAYLVKTKKLSNRSIFTVTFTNKASHEMKERISSLTGKDMNGSWIGTFHSQCSKILRKEIAAVGYKSDFSIYDDDDQRNLIRHILKEFGIHEALYRGVAARIGALKASLVEPEDFLSTGDGFGFDEKLARVYVRYQDELKRSNALDFDDLIGITVMLFEKCPGILKKYQSDFPYILVDEFQDTNYAQYKLLRLFGSSHRNISVVGDDDQSIYRFRGADVTHVFRFEKDFPGTRTICLEQNYRSTQNILDVAGTVISRNPVRKEKKLWTGRGCGERVYHCWLSDEDEEARHIARTVKEFYLKGQHEYRDFAVLYRVNIQSRVVEEALRDEGLPYLIMGGISFFQRKEVKDIVAYMRLISNRNDNVSLRRIINCPPRGIGAATLSRVEQEAKKKSENLFDALKHALKNNSGMLKKPHDLLVSLEGFVTLIEELAAVKYKSAAEMFKDIVEKTGYRQTADEERMQHIDELIASGTGIGVKEFMEKVSLMTNLDDSAQENAVSLMTLHTAKGLEFPVVFIIGLEEGLLPYFKAADDTDEINEERRLFYVGMTRAKDVLWLTGAGKRRLYAKVQNQEPSRFLADISGECCQLIEKSVRSNFTRTVAKRSLDLPKRISPYMTGCRVRHPKWGVGVVRDCYGDGDEEKVTVNFPNIGIKKLVLRFANLEKI
ncbi:MAG: DUF3553 domain-containing protein [Thermodesulfovibrionales bacterium]